MHFVKWPPRRGSAWRVSYWAYRSTRSSAGGQGDQDASGPERDEVLRDLRSLGNGAGWGGGSRVPEGGGAQRLNVWALNT